MNYIEGQPIKNIKTHHPITMATPLSNPLPTLAPILISALLAASIFSQYSGLDMALSSLIYGEQQQWAYRSTYWLQDIIHRGGRNFFTAFYLLLLAAHLVERFLYKIQKSSLAYILLSITATLIGISALKNMTVLPCPWDTEGLGGDIPFLKIHEVFSLHKPAQKCFPAGHSSAGFSLICFYFLAKYRGFKHPIIYALPAIFFGMLFGIAQQLRGAHFLSHDLMTAFIASAITMKLASYYFSSSKTGAIANKSTFLLRYFQQQLKHFLYAGRTALKQMKTQFLSPTSPKSKFTDTQN